MSHGWAVRYRITRSRLADKLFASLFGNDPIAQAQEGGFQSPPGCHRDSCHYGILQDVDDNRIQVAPAYCALNIWSDEFEVYHIMPEIKCIAYASEHPKREPLQYIDGETSLICKYPLNCHGCEYNRGSLRKFTLRHQIQRKQHDD
jgi:hypothetical protein